jgi:dihydrofolate reductase
MAAGLVDRLQLFVHPLLLGTGKRLFGELPSPRTLSLEHCSATALGSVVLTYRFDAAVG